MKTLQKLLGDTSLENFLDKHFTRLPFSRPHGADEFRHLLNWETVKSIIAEDKSVLRIVKDGKMVSDYVKLSFDEVKIRQIEGSTLLVRFAERSDSRLREIAEDFARSFHTEVDIQLYCTPENHNAFGWHYDVEEVFILQCQGSKHYTIRPNTIHPNPLLKSIPKDQGYERESSKTAIQVTLEEGDWLYIPSGWWHRAETRKESMHISIGLMPRSALDLIEAFPEFLAQDVFWRTRMPIHNDFASEEEEIVFYQEAIEKLGMNLTKQFSNEAFIKDFLKRKKNRALTRKD
ncbi:MAG: cupin domain-containing protein [Bdellovibrionota bacterium]